MTILLVVINLLFLSAAPIAAQQTDHSVAAAVSLLPGDLLRVSVWREPDLSGEFLVEQNGSVVLPLIGDVDVIGRPFLQLRDSLLTEYGRQLSRRFDGSTFSAR